MVGGVPDPEGPPRTPSRWPRGWLSYSQYKDIHWRYLEALYRRGLVEDDDLTFYEVVHETSGGLLKIRLEGHVTCTNGARVRVLIWMDVRGGEDGRPEVLSIFYQYHAWEPATASGEKGPDQLLVRYDQAHGGSPHRHFITAGGEERVETLALDDIPRLDEVILEAFTACERLVRSQADVAQGDDQTTSRR